MTGLNESSSQFYCACGKFLTTFISFHLSGWYTPTRDKLEKCANKYMSVIAPQWKKRQVQVMMDECLCGANQSKLWHEVWWLSDKACMSRNTLIPKLHCCQWGKKKRWMKSKQKTTAGHSRVHVCVWWVVLRCYLKLVALVDSETPLTPETPLSLINLYIVIFRLTLIYWMDKKSLICSLKKMLPER